MSDTAQGHTINLDYVFVNTEGEALKDNGKDLTARKLVTTCLLNDDPREQAKPEEKHMAGMLAFRKLNKPNPNFTPEELAFMKKRCAQGCTSLVWFQMEALLDGKADPLCE